jgi:hypothetical protein
VISHINPSGHEERYYTDRVEVVCSRCGHVTVYDFPTAMWDDNPTHPCTKGEA